MKQLTQELKKGHMEILEVPFPIPELNDVLVRNCYSVISAGTESKTVSDARKGYVAKAMSRQKELKAVLQSIKTEGLKKTYNLVMNKLSAPSSLGYSCAGEVIAVGEDVSGILPGDYVACGGGGAVHAEIVAVQKNLCVKLPHGIDIKEASFATIASIAIQGIRRADLRFGENCVVIGLGLIGQLTIKILRASGIQAIGVDISPVQVKMAIDNGADAALVRSQEGIESVIHERTSDFGADAVIITAGTSSTDPVEFAGKISRSKGRVVIVGAVPTGFSREQYYKKELDLRMSTSYGPGRYDPDYEQKGIDYPIGYVRFTENRNMKTFVDLLASGNMDIKGLITHEIEFNNASAAYGMVLERTEPFCGIVLKYDTDKELPKTSVNLNKPIVRGSGVNAAFIGAGNFAQNAILPRLKGKCTFLGVMTAHGNSSRYVADKYGFSYCTDKATQILCDENVNTVFIATRHNTHANLAAEALKCGKNVFVEKPLSISEGELEAVKEAYVQAPDSRLMVGFNRRFSPFVTSLNSMLPQNLARSILIRVNASRASKGHWVNDPEIGGGRILGEVCHFIDIAFCIAGSKPQALSAFTQDDNISNNDTCVVNIRFANGSIANISYFSNGSKEIEKEYIEVFCANTVYQIFDFNTLKRNGKNVSVTSTGKQDKGHDAELNAFVHAIQTGADMPIRFDEYYWSTVATLKTLESIKSNRVITFDVDQ